MRLLLQLQAGLFAVFSVFCLVVSAILEHVDDGKSTRSILMFLGFILSSINMHLILLIWLQFYKSPDAKDPEEQAE